jgi:hypothetical protein
MLRRVFEPLSVVATLVIIALLWAPAPAAGQAQSRQQVQEAARKASPRTGDEALKFFEKDVEEATARAIARVWDPTKPTGPSPRTSWGAPDLRGYWLSLSYTPLERPEGVTKALYTPQEAIEQFKKDVAEDAAVDPATVHYDWKEFGMDNWQSPVRPNLRTALIVDPPDGKLPALSAEGQKRQAAAQAAAKIMDPQASVSTLGNLYTRCITGNQGPPRLPFNHDSESQIIQTPTHVIILTQSNNDARIIPLDGRPHLDTKVKAWLGDPRGRWEGDTLVVESTNFHPNRAWRGSRDGLHLVERFTRVDDSTLKYEFTVTDPATWSRPWTTENIWPAIEPPIFEFACHEQNYGVINVVAGAQIRATEGGGRGQAGAGGGGE